MGKNATFTTENQNEFIREIVGNIHNENYVIDDTSSILIGDILLNKTKDEIYEYIIEKGNSIELANELTDLILKYEKITAKFENKAMIVLASYYKHA